MKTHYTPALQEVLSLSGLDWHVDGAVHVFKATAVRTMQQIQELMKEYDYRLIDISIFFERNVCHLRYSKEDANGHVHMMVFWYMSKHRYVSMRRAIFYPNENGTYVRFGGPHAVTFGLLQAETDRLVRMFRQEHPDVPYTWGPIFS